MGQQNQPRGRVVERIVKKSLVKNIIVRAPHVVLCDCDIQWKKREVRDKLEKIRMYINDK